MSNLLITGGTGFVGGHLVKAAHDAGHNIFLLVRENSNRSYLNFSGITFLIAELTDESALEKAFLQLKDKKVKIDFVIHCAAVTKAKSLDVFLKVNTEGTVLLLDFVKQYQAQIKQFVFVSSLAASGPTEFGKTILLEDENPITDYGRSKLEAEKILKKSNLPYVIFRPTAVFGPREKDIFTLFEIVYNGVLPLIGSHQQALTFIYVHDLVTLLLSALNVSEINKTYFVTDGNVYDKSALGDCISKQRTRKPIRFTIPLGIVKTLAFFSQSFYGIQGKLAPLNSEKYKELKAASWNCDTKKTFEDFNFKPLYDLEKGVKETALWYEKEEWLSALNKQ
jgi:UDP-glucose 4-epimerase